MHVPSKEPGLATLDLREPDYAIESPCPGCGEWRLIEYDTASQRWVYAVCDRQRGANEPNQID